MDTKVKNLVESAISNIQELSDADTVIGKPIKVDGNITIIPISKVSYGFAAGGSDLPSKNDKELFGGGSGAGVSIAPLAFLVINNGDVSILHMNQDTSTSAGIINMVPDLFNKVSSIFSKKKGDSAEVTDVENVKSTANVDISDQLGDTSDFDF